MATYTYDAASLDQALNYIRFRLGDVGPDFRLSDEEIEAYAPGGVVGMATNQSACIALVRGLIARYTGVVDASEGGASFSGSQLVAQYRELLRTLQSEGTSAVSVTGGFYTGTTMPPAFTRIAGDPDWPTSLADGVYE